MKNKAAVLERFNSAALLTWLVFWLVLGFSFFMAAISGQDLYQKSFSKTLISLTLAHIAMMSVFYFGRSVIERFPQVFILAVIAVLVRGFSFVLLLNLFGLEGDPNWTIRLGGGSITNLVALTISTLAVGSLLQHRQHMAQFLQQNDELLQIRDQVNFELNDQHEQVIKSIKSQLAESLKGAKSKSGQAFRDLMKQTATEVVGPISYEFAKPSTETLSKKGVYESKLDWKSLISDASNGNSLSAFWISFSMNILASYWVFTFLTPLKALLFLGEGFLFYYLLLKGANLILLKISVDVSPVVRAVIMSAMLLLIGTFTGLSSILTSTKSNNGNLIGIVEIILVPTFGWLIAGATAAQNQRLRMESEVQVLNESLEWQIARARATLWQQRNKITRTLHGPIQGAIGGAAVRVDMALRKGEDTKSLHSELLARIDEAISQLDKDEAPTSRTLLLSQLQQLYEGVTEVRLEESKEATLQLNADPICASMAVEIIQEAVWNSIKHGKARGIEVSLRLVEENILELKVKDFGTRETIRIGNREGLGTAMLNAVTIDWHREIGETGAELTCQLPIKSLSKI